MSYGSALIRVFHESVNSVFGFSSRGEGPVLGLEFENEMPIDIALPKISGWRIHAEGSLRDYGYEYVSSSPQKEEVMKRSVKLLFRRVSEACEEAEAVIGGVIRPSNSIRTSVHLHIDAGELTYIQILNFSVIYWLLEDLLAAFCGKDRKGNLFCLRLKDASYQKHGLISDIKDRSPYSSAVFQDSCRYASLNLASVRKFGSLESRLMRGTTDLDTVYLWIDLLLAIYNFAKSGIGPGNGSFLTPKDFQKDFLNSCDAKDYPKRVLGDSLFNRLKSSCSLQMGQSIATDIRENYIELQDLFNAHSTFDFFSEAKEQEEKLKSGPTKTSVAKAPAATIFPSWATQEFLSMVSEQPITAPPTPPDQPGDNEGDSGVDQAELYSDFELQPIDVGDV